MARAKLYRFFTDLTDHWSGKIFLQFDRVRWVRGAQRDRLPPTGMVNDNYSSPSVRIKTHHSTGLPLVVYHCCVTASTSEASSLGGAESLAPSGDKDAAEPKELAAAAG